MTVDAGRAGAPDCLRSLCRSPSRRLTPRRSRSGSRRPLSLRPIELTDEALVSQGARELLLRSPAAARVLTVVAVADPAAGDRRLGILHAVYSAAGRRVAV